MRRGSLPDLLPLNAGHFVMRFAQGGPAVPARIEAVPAQASSAVLHMSRCQRVRISPPLKVTARVCTYWAESFLPAVN
jgi:hypothetical protein